MTGSIKARARQPGESALEALQSMATAIRRGAVAGIYHAGSGHPGGALSAADLLACLYGEELRPQPYDAASETRDRFVLSKGHCCPALYAAAAEIGLLSRDQVCTLRKLGSPLQGHPHVLDLPWTETSTGSLGQGFSVSIGMAMGLRHLCNPARVYVMLGDGELQEGEVWEGAMCAAHYKLDNLCGIVDYNKMQSDDLNANIMGLEPLADKWRSFGWQVTEIDGHSISAIRDAFAQARATKGKPAMIIAHTIKGKGVSYMEASPLWHGSVKLKREEVALALADLHTPEESLLRYLDGK